MVAPQAFGRIVNAEPVSHPDEEQQLSLFKERLLALRTLSTEDNRSRWFARADRAVEICCVWYVLQCTLTYRFARISGFAMGVDGTEPKASAASLEKRAIDGGIIRCCTSLLMDKRVRAIIFNYACTCATFRKRCGMRTANRAPPGQQATK